MIAKVRVARKVRISTWPIGSARRARSAFDSGTKRIVSAKASRQTGTFSQKIASQPIPETSAPPRTGPNARLIPNAVPHKPIAGHVPVDRRRRW